MLRLLPPTLIDRIAAGEVIERPAAALKELVENAIDAGATQIDVALDGGGIDRIEVADNGTGMLASELPLAIQRHATSKLPDDDLVRIATLGFRGEALPSIGAAARLAIVSRRQGADHASRIEVNGGAVGEVAPASHPIGTTVTVRDLFYATPARRKFLKSSRAEADAAEAALTRLAYAAPRIGFRLTLDGRTALDLPPQSRSARIAALLGPQAAAALMDIDHDRGPLRLEGRVALPSVTRATAAAQAFVVNDRPVNDPVLRTALRVAYRNVIEYGRHPIAALYLTVPPELLDVNVHPAKTELRYADADAIRALVIGGIQRCLALPAGGVTGAGPRPSTSTPPPRVAWPEAAERAPLAEMRLDLGAAPPPPDTATSPGAPTGAPTDQPLGTPLAQLLETYILARAPDGGLVLVDQHAAHERLTQEALTHELLAGGVRAQALLLPVVVELPRAESAALLAHATTLARLGLEIEPFGDNAVLLRAIPAVLAATHAPDGAALLGDLAAELRDTGQTTALEALLDAAIARLACHGSIRAGRRLAPAEMDALLRRMEATPRAATCSHGRPTFLKFTQADLEKLFGRR